MRQRMGSGYSYFFFFKQKTAYEIRKGDWSSDVCSSDLRIEAGAAPGLSFRFVSTPGGGGGTGRPKMLFSIHFPRRTGDVRSGYDVVASSAPSASRPPR